MKFALLMPSLGPFAWNTLSTVTPAATGWLVCFAAIPAITTPTAAPAADRMPRRFTVRSVVSPVSPLPVPLSPLQAPIRARTPPAFTPYPPVLVRSGTRYAVVLVYGPGEAIAMHDRHSCWHFFRHESVEAAQPNRRAGRRVQWG